MFCFIILLVRGFYTYIDVVDGDDMDEDDHAPYYDDNAQHAVSRSYEWLVAVINHLSSESMYTFIHIYIHIYS